jgi:glycosyltransferase-like protein
MSGLRIAMLAHSTNPRGGVVHALELCEALAGLGHQPTLFAPDVSGQGFFRAAKCALEPLPASPAPRDVAAMVHQRVAEYMTYFTPVVCARFDLFHAQDSISANALADLRDAWRIREFARTVHHIDDFSNPELLCLQARGVEEAAQLFTVSKHSRNEVKRCFGRDAICVGNGVNLELFSPRADARDAALRAKLGLESGLVVLSLGGVEPRKNSLSILKSFQILREDFPAAVLIVAGGATLLDHGAYQAEFASALAQSGLPENAVWILGRLTQDEIPTLYRLADVLAFPSLREGFGLAVLEAMASGLPVVVPRVEPFTEYLTENDAAWCDASDPFSIAEGLRLALGPRGETLRRRGLAVAQRWRWQDVAKAHLPAYEKMRSHEHA